MAIRILSSENINGTVSGTRFILPSTAGGVNQWIYTNNTNTGTGSLTIQSGAGSASYGGAIKLFSHSNASKPGWVTAGISSGSGGKFSVNTQGLGGGTDVFTVDTSGNATFAGQVSVGNYAIPSDHQFQIAHLGQSYARFALTNSQTGNGSSDGLIFQMENLNSIIKNQENGTLGFGTNGRETDILIDSSGNVGIGTASPSANLHVQNTSTATLKVITTGVADASVNIQGYDAGVHIGDATNGLRWAIWNDGPSTSSSLKFGSYALGTWYSDGSQVVTMKSDGKVGIGTTSPSTALHIDQLSNDRAGGLYIERNGSSYGLSAFVNSGGYGVIGSNGSFTTDILTMNLNNGNVGIGAAAPGAKLDVNGATYVRNVIYGYAGAGNQYGGLSWASTDTGFLFLKHNNVTKVVINANDNSYFNGGNVGIGTTSPDRSLDVRGTGMSIFGTGNYTELMLRGQVEGTGTVRNVGAWHWSIRSDVGGDNDDLKLLRFNTGSYSGTSMQIRSDNGGVAIGVNNSGYSSQILSVKSGTSDSVFYGESSDANCFASFRDNSSTANIEYGAIGNAHIFRKDAAESMRIDGNGNVGIGTTNPSSELEVAGRAIVEKLEVARYGDVNAPAPVYVGRLANPMGAGGVFRLAAIESSSTVNKIDEPFLITYSSGHWGCQPMFFAEFTVTYYRGSYIKYWAQHEVSASRLQIVDGPYGGQIISGGAPVSRTITTLCNNCHAGQPVYKCVWKWSNSGTYIKTSPIVSLVDGHGSARVYTSGSSSESAIDTLLGSAGSPGPAYLLMGINNAQAAGFTGLQTQN